LRPFMVPLGWARIALIGGPTATPTDPPRPGRSGSATCVTDRERRLQGDLVRRFFDFSGFLHQIELPKR